MRGRVGTPSYYTSDPGFDPGDNQFSLELIRLPARRGVIETTVVGPFNLPFHQYVMQRERERAQREGLAADVRKQREKELEASLERAGVQRRLDLPLRLTEDDRQLCWEVSRQKGCLTPGAWSDWVVLDFPLNWLVDALQPLRGMVRFKLIALEPEIELYMMPINFHPSCHPVAYSWPPDWAEELSDSVGPFKTIGWAVDTWSYPSGVGGIDLFIEDMNATIDQSEKILYRTLTEDPPDIVAHYFEFTDRAGHMMWHELDEGHPLHVPKLAPRYREAMRKTYQRMDEIIGRVRQMVGPELLFLVASDHGFSSFRRQINYNTWLYQRGYLSLKGKTRARNLEQLFDKDVSGVDVFSGIEWSRTKAWAMGLGAIYINLVGREAQGIVMPGEEYEQVIGEIRDGLEQEIDPATGECPVFKVYRREEIYHGFDPAKIPDLRPANKLNYRVSWQDTLGGLSTDVFEDNLRYWSGDHCSLEPSLVPGILIVNRKLKLTDPRIEDVAPSILGELGLAPDETLDGRTMW
jgi:predicted AlkP superfamily phosphohydrolase/phosphomutase